MCVLVWVCEYVCTKAGETCAHMYVCLHACVCMRVRVMVCVHEGVCVHECEVCA